MSHTFHSAKLASVVILSVLVFPKLLTALNEDATPSITMHVSHMDWYSIFKLLRKSVYFYIFILQVGFEISMQNFLDIHP